MFLDFFLDIYSGKNRMFYPNSLPSEPFGDVFCAIEDGGGGFNNMQNLASLSSK